MFMVLRKRQVLAGLGGLLLAAGILTGVLIRTVQAAAPDASADTNWGLSFQQEGKTPVGNASSEFLSQYDACYAGSSDEKVISQLEALYEETTGQKMQKYYRPPQGKFSESNLKQAQELGYRTVFWSLAYVDWYQDKQPSREEAFQKLLSRIHPGAVVLLHSTSQTNAEILDELLTRWEQMGYTFGTLPQLYEKMQGKTG